MDPIIIANHVLCEYLHKLTNYGVIILASYFVISIIFIATKALLTTITTQHKAIPPSHWYMQY